jgi:hypothetical protein
MESLIFDNGDSGLRLYYDDALHIDMIKAGAIITFTPTYEQMVAIVNKMNEGIEIRDRNIEVTLDEAMKQKWVCIKYQPTVDFFFYKGCEIWQDNENGCLGCEFSK